MPGREPFSLKLPEGLRLAGQDVPVADGRQVPLYLFRRRLMKLFSLPFGSRSLTEVLSLAYPD